MQKSYILVGILLVIVLSLTYFIYSKGYFGKLDLTQVLPTQNTAVSTSNEKKTETPKAESVTTNKILLTIISPVNGETLNSTDATVKGKTVANADVFVNDQAGKADTTGNFSIKVPLEEGENQIEVFANDQNGNVSQLTLSVSVVSY